MLMQRTSSKLIKQRNSVYVLQPHILNHSTVTYTRKLSHETPTDRMDTQHLLFSQLLQQIQDPNFFK